MARRIYSKVEDICKAKDYDKYVGDDTAYPCAVGILSAKINSLLFWMDTAHYQASVNNLRELIWSTFADILEPEEKKEG